MPVTGSKNRIYGNYGDYAAAMGLGQINTAGFLFGDEDEAAKKDTATSPDVKNYLQMNATDDKFPILVRRDEYPGLVSGAQGTCLKLDANKMPAALCLIRCVGPRIISVTWSGVSGQWLDAIRPFLSIQYFSDQCKATEQWTADRYGIGNCFPAVSGSGR